MTGKPGKPSPQQQTPIAKEATGLQQQPLMERRRILVVDDDETVTNLWGLLLEGSGIFAVRGETRGTRAVATAENFQPDLILLDCNLPDRHGFDIAADFQAHDRLRSVPLAFVTGSIWKKQAVQGRLCGYPVIPKPFQPGDLLGYIIELTGKS